MIGRGSFGDVYLGVDPVLEREAAVKVLDPVVARDEDALGRFFQEARALAKLEHPRIAGVWEMGEDHGRYFIAMRYIPGQPLNALVKARGSLGWEEALKITTEVAEALQYAHDKGFVHRDIKPGNIILHPESGAVLTDFGLVKALSGVSLTRTGMLVGTPEYMANEIINGGEASPASDQFGLACVLVEMLTGASPFAAPTPIAVIAKHAQKVNLPEVWAGDVPAGMTAVLRRALKPDPQERYASIADFTNALTQAQKPPEHVVIAKPKPAVEQATTWAEPSQERYTTTSDSSETLSDTDVEKPAVPEKVAPPEVKRESQIVDEYQIALPGGVKMDFVYVPAGEFLMGAAEDDEDAYTYEKPQHKVYLDGYWIGKFPVTNEQYRAYVQHGGGEEPVYADRFTDPQKRCHPVVGVDWYDAEKFCQWLSQYSGERVGLPTEAQWEKAARGMDGRRYPWGDRPPTLQLANYSRNNDDTTPVGSYPSGASPYGALDMAGNVWEWCTDWYDEEYYKKSPPKNPQGPGSGDGRVVRGGLWGYILRDLRVSYRDWNFPDYRGSFGGFRCLRRAAP